MELFPEEKTKKRNGVNVNGTNKKDWFKRK
jgi:hypothetical protein